MSNNIFIDTVSRFRNNTTVQELVVDFRDQIKLKIFKRTTLQPQTLIKKFHVLQRRYAKNKKPEFCDSWQENERKVFIWFILAYSRLHFKKLSQITDKEWAQISTSFGQKNVLLMKYESKCLQKNSQRVRWTPEEEKILKSCIEGQLNGRWSEISKVLFFKTNAQHFKTAKQCRQHWFNHLNDNIKRGQWTVEQDLAILTFVLKEGHHWSRIVERLSHNRTEHMVKNRFGSLLTCSKKLLPEKVSQFSEIQLIQLLAKELNTNKEIIVLQNQLMHKESEEQGVELLSQMVKQEQKQYQGNFQITEKQINHKIESEVKITEDKENIKTMQNEAPLCPSTTFKQQKRDQNSSENNIWTHSYYDFLPPLQHSYSPYYYPHYYPSQIHGPIPGNPFFHFLTGLDPRRQSSTFLDPMGYLSPTITPKRPGQVSTMSRTSQDCPIVKEEI